MIHWRKMHTHNIDGSCVECKGRCTNERSIKEWKKLRKKIRSFEEIFFSNENKRLKKLLEKRKKKLNY